MKQKIVLVGAGFAGIQLAQNLDEKIFDVLIIDKINHHQFQPLFYQVATSQIEPSSISFPLRNIFNKKRNVQIRLAEALEVKPAENILRTSIGEFKFDHLVLAMGCKTNFFGNLSIEKHALTLKSTSEAITIRNHVIKTFEKIISSDAYEKAALLNLVIVGAGPTGVELAGSFAEIKLHVLPKDYPGIDFSKFKIFLIEGSQNTLNNMSEKSKKDSQAYLQSMGVEILTGKFVKDYNGRTLILNDGQTIETSTVIWAAGVVANGISGLENASIMQGNRIKVNRQNAIIGYDNLYAIGDLCLMETPKYPKGHPQLANVAINQAKTLAKNLKYRIQNKRLIDYEYKDLGTMATIGRNKAVVDFGKLHLKGYIAWFIWMSLHLMLILSIKNKLIIFINWAWAYLTKDTSLRLILNPEKNIE